jgi:hypothetical protein
VPMKTPCSARALIMRCADEALADEDGAGAEDLADAMALEAREAAVRKREADQQGGDKQARSRPYRKTTPSPRSTPRSWLRQTRRSQPSTRRWLH